MARSLKANCAMLFGTLVFIGLFFAFMAFLPIPAATIVAAIIAVPLCWVDKIIGYAIRKGKEEKKPKSTRLLCPRCHILADKQSGICPQCGNKL